MGRLLGSAGKKARGTDDLGAAVFRGISKEQPDSCGTTDVVHKRLV
jgi:hypothetical protein